RHRVLALPEFVLADLAWNGAARFIQRHLEYRISPLRARAQVRSARSLPRGDGADVPLAGVWGIRQRARAARVVALRGIVARRRGRLVHLVASPADRTELGLEIARDPHRISNCAHLQLRVMRAQ